MTTGKPSGAMTRTELRAQRLRCPDCGSQGIEREPYQLGSSIMIPITGLDLDDCDGCRRMLSAHRGTLIGLRPAS